MRRTLGLSIARIALASLLLPALAGPGPVRAAAAGSPITVSAGPLSAALARIAVAAGVEIVSLEPGLPAQSVPAQVLPAEPERALNRLLAGTGLRAVRIGPRSFRIERRPALAGRPAARPAPPAEPGEPEPVTVVASKFPTSLRDYPGTVARLPEADAASLPIPFRLEDLGRRLPTVFATAFGDGRDKLFVRGIADSSFNGASQPATAIYFDDAPIGFGSPNANLRLYDIGSVEVLEGPQGTLYGGGSIGGVIRITPKPVDLARQAGSLTGETSVPQGGQPGWKLGGALNLPLLPDVAGIRVVGYDERQGGYIDVPEVGSNLNRVDVSGARAALTVEPDPALKIDAGGLFQRTRARDAQYADGSGALRHTAALRQPYGSDLALGRLGLRKRWDSGLSFVATASFGHRSSFDRFDASADAMGAGATVYDLQRTSSTWAGEARLMRLATRGINWVVGLGLERNEDGQSRAFGSPDGALVLDEVTNVTRSASLFGQGRWAIVPAVQFTVGLRYTVARTDSEPSRGQLSSYIRGFTARHADPTVALMWHVDERLTAFARFQTGYRNGGVTVARGVGRVSDFQPDSIVMSELGLRLQPRGASGLTLSSTLSYARWNDVLADLVTRRGTPITTNIGNARLLALEGAARWKDRSGWTLAASALFTANRLAGDLAAQTPSRNRRLPNTPALTAQVDAGYGWHTAGGAERALAASLRYVGSSVLGPGALLDLRQGDYTVVDLVASSRRGPLIWRLSCQNLFNTHADRFALGNPLLLYQRQGYAPVAPRTVALGFALEL